jgi:hypothetical protein
VHIGSMGGILECHRFYERIAAAVDIVLYCVIESGEIGEVRVSGSTQKRDFLQSPHWVDVWI